MIRRSGHSSSALAIPDRTRSFASWQALSGSPTIAKARYAPLEVGLDLDRPRVETDEGMGDGARKHSFEAREEGARVARRSAPTSCTAVTTRRGRARCAHPRPRLPRSERRAPASSGRSASQASAARRTRRAFSGPDRLHRVAVVSSRPGLHLADRDRPAAADDDVELVAPGRRRSRRGSGIRGGGSGGGPAAPPQARAAAATSSSAGPSSSSA